MSESKAKIIINLNGSARVEADLIEIVLQDGTIVEKEGRVSICRCAQSKKPPFCDGYHKGDDVTPFDN